MRQEEKHKLEFIVILNDRLVDIEIKQLKSDETMYGVKNVEYRKSTILLQVDEPANVMSTIASWLATVGADGSIFAIQKIDTFYTGYVSNDVRELIKTK